MLVLECVNKLLIHAVGGAQMKFAFAPRRTRLKPIADRHQSPVRSAGTRHTRGGTLCIAATRNLHAQRGFLVAAGLEQALEFLEKCSVMDADGPLPSRRKMKWQALLGKKLKTTPCKVGG